MLEIIFQALIIMFVFEAVMFVIRWWMNAREQARIDQELTEIFTDLRNNCKMVYVETVGNVHLMYDQLTNSFVCQGNTEDELWQRARSLHPNKEFVLKNTVNGVPTFNFRPEQ